MNLRSDRKIFHAIALEGVPKSEPFYRLLTTILDPQQASGEELAALYHERWEIETTLDEFKVHFRGTRWILRSKTPDLVRQEFYGFLLTHFAIRALMHEAALSAQQDPDRLSFTHAVRVIRRALQRFHIPPSEEYAALHQAVLQEILEEPVSSSRGRYVPRGVKRKISKYPLRPRARHPVIRINVAIKMLN